MATHRDAGRRSLTLSPESENDQSVTDCQLFATRLQLTLSHLP